MRVVLSAGKRGHYYLTARALQQEGVLARFLTATFFRERGLLRHVAPRRYFEVRRDPALEGAEVVSLWPCEAAYRAVRAVAGRRRCLMRLYNRLFDVASIPFLRGAGDVFHVANTYALASSRAAKRAGMKVVIDQQGVHPLYRREVLPPAYRRLGLEPPRDPGTEERIARELEQADLILAPSRFVRDQNLRAGIPAERQRVVPVGADTALFQPVPRLRGRDEPLRLLFVGGISPAKGVLTLLEAVRRIGSRYLRLLLVGRLAPGMSALLAPYAHLFDHRPPMPQPALAGCYHRADLFCLPSLAEGSALVVYEAMASGLPCVVTPATGSAIEHGVDGWIVPPSNPDRLAEALETLVTQPELRTRLGAAARKTACRHDIASYGRRLLEAYAALEASPAAAPAAKSA